MTGSGDGAYQGVTPTNALKVLLGGHKEEDVPHVGEIEFVAMVRGAVLPAEDDKSSYDGQTLATARLILEAYETDPELVDLDERELYDAIKDLYPEHVAMITSLTGFMWGWGINAARKIIHVDPINNPAILTLGSE